MQTNCSTSTNRRHCALIRVKGLAEERPFNSRQRYCTRWNATVAPEGKKSRALSNNGVTCSTVQPVQHIRVSKRTRPNRRAFPPRLPFGPEPRISDLVKLMNAREQNSLGAGLLGACLVHDRIPANSREAILTFGKEFRRQI